MPTIRQATPRNELNHYKWLILAVAVVAQTTAAVATQGIGVLAGFIQDSLQLSNADIGLLAGVLNIAPVLGLLVVGQWLDRANIRIVIGIGAVVMGVAMALTGWVSTFGVLLLCLFLVGVGYSTAQPGGSKAVFQWFPARERGLAMGVRQAGLPIGGPMAAAIFPGIAHTLGWRAAFLAGAVITGAAGRVLLAAWSDQAHGGRSRIVMMAIAGTLSGLIALGLYPIGSNRELLLPVVAWFGFFAFGWYGPWVAQVSEVAPGNQVGATLGLAMAFNQIAIVLAPIVFGALIDGTAGFAIPGAVLIAALLGYMTYLGVHHIIMSNTGRVRVERQ